MYKATDLKIINVKIPSTNILSITPCIQSVFNACLWLRSLLDTSHTPNSLLSVPMRQKPQDPATTQLPQRLPSKNHISRKLPSPAACWKKHSFSTLLSFSPSYPDPTELANHPRESLWLTKLEDQRMWWITPCELHLCCLTVPASAQGFLMCLWVFTNTTPFFPLNHLRVKCLSAGSFPINAANMTRWIPLPGTADQRPKPSVQGCEITGWF